MPRHAETRRVPYTQEQMFDLVADVARYPEFLPWVSAVRISADGPTEMVADVLVGFKALRERFTSKVEKARPDHIHVDYIAGPLDHLRNEWSFTPDREGGCRIDFLVDFAFRSHMFEVIAGQVFDRSLRRMIGAFEARAAALYGVSSSPIRAEGSSRPSAQSAA